MAKNKGKSCLMPYTKISWGWWLMTFMHKTTEKKPWRLSNIRMGKNVLRHTKHKSWTGAVAQ